MIQGNRNPYIDHPEYVALVWQCTGLIPVTLIDFKATKYNGSVTLTWYATRETNFNNYAFERSTDGVHFIQIGIVKGENLANYSFTDKALPASNTCFYRLKMTDTDNRFTISKIISVRLNNNFSNALLFPNPSAGSLTLQLEHTLQENSHMQVFDLAGRKVLEQFIPAGQNVINIEGSALPNGSYLVKICNFSEQINKSFLIAR
jgi:hypothetical protein